MTFPTWSTIIKNTFDEFRIDDDITIQSMNISMVICVLGDNSSCLLWANATILDRQSLVSSTTQDVEIHLLKMKMHQRTRLTTLRDRKKQTVFALSWWHLTKWIAFSSHASVSRLAPNEENGKKNKSCPLKFCRPSGKVASRLVGLPLGYCRWRYVPSLMANVRGWPAKPQLGLGQHAKRNQRKCLVLKN